MKLYDIIILSDISQIAIMKIISQCKVDAAERPWTLDWNPQGNMLITAGSSKTATIWKHTHQTTQPPKLQKQQSIQTEHTKTIRCVKFNHTGDKLAMGSFDATISVWVLSEDGYEMLGMLEGHESEVKCVSWSYVDESNSKQKQSNGKTYQKLASCSRDKNVWIWQFDQINYEYTCSAVLEGHTQDVKHVQWFPKLSHKLLSAGYDNTIRIWQSQDDDYVCRQVLEGHQSIVWSVQIVGQHCEWLFSVGEDCTVIQWGITNQKQSKQMKQQNAVDKYEKYKVYTGLHILPIYTLCMFNSQYLLTGSADNTLAITGIPSLMFSNTKDGKAHDVDTMQNQSKQMKMVPFARVSHESDINCIKLNPKYPHILASCSDDETIGLWTIDDTNTTLNEQSKTE